LYTCSLAKEMRETHIRGKCANFRNDGGDACIIG
jgi:hypothetical protein